MSPPPAGELAGAWGGDPGALAALLGGSACYLVGVRRRPAGTSARARDLAFAGAMVALVAALASPIDTAARYLLWVHMLQHVLLVQVAAPLLVLAVPARVLRRVAPRWLVRPSIAFAALAAAWWLWHLPALYDAAVRNPMLHATEHVTLLGAAVLWWSCVLGPQRVAPFPRLALMFATALHLNVLGALITLAPRVVFTAYSGAYGLAALEDQQLAGVLMWTTGGLLTLVLVALSVAELLRDEPTSPNLASM